jgi:serpin B
LAKKKLPYTGASDSIARACNGFGKKLLLEILKEKPLENAVISAVSIEVALAMAAEGALGETRKELYEALGINFEDPALKKAYDEFVSVVFEKEHSVEIVLANSIWARDVIEPTYKDMTRTVFDAEVSALTVPEPINKWVNDKTHGKIQAIIDEVRDETKLLIVNAIYFKAAWSTVFKQANNQQLPFYNAERDAKTVAFMVRDDEDLFYYEDEKVQVLDLPYMSAKWYARVVLPKKSLAKEGKTALDVLLTETEFDVTTIQTRQREGCFKMPRFTVGFGPASLNNILKALGIRKAFTAGDFTPMSKEVEMYVSNVVHAAIMEVTEEGTVAAAVTAVDCISISLNLPTVPFEMIVDRPFMFSIISRPPVTTLFTSAVYQIKQ